MADKVMLNFVVTPIDKGNVPQSIRDHQANVNSLPCFPCGCGYYHTQVIAGQTQEFLVSEFVHWEPES